MGVSKVVVIQGLRSKVIDKVFADLFFMVDAEVVFIQGWMSKVL